MESKKAFKKKESESEESKVAAIDPKKASHEKLSKLTNEIVLEAKRLTSGQKTSAYQLQLLCREHTELQGQI